MWLRTELLDTLSELGTISSFGTSAQCSAKKWLLDLWALSDRDSKEQMFFSTFQPEDK